MQVCCEVCTIYEWSRVHPGCSINTGVSSDLQTFSGYVCAGHCSPVHYIQCFHGEEEPQNSRIHNWFNTQTMNDPIPSIQIHETDLQNIQSLLHQVLSLGRQSPHNGVPETNLQVVTTKEDGMGELDPGIQSLSCNHDLPPLLLVLLLRL